MLVNIFLTKINLKKKHRHIFFNWDLVWANDFVSLSAPSFGVQLNGPKLLSNLHNIMHHEKPWSSLMVYFNCCQLFAITVSVSVRKFKFDSPQLCYSLIASVQILEQAINKKKIITQTSPLAMQHPFSNISPAQTESRMRKPTPQCAVGVMLPDTMGLLHCGWPFELTLRLPTPSMRCSCHATCYNGSIGWHSELIIRLQLLVHASSETYYITTSTFSSVLYLLILS